jgi:hypothetical protein
MDVRSNVLCTAWFKQGRALARRGVPGERRYAPVLENAQVRSTAEHLRSTALCQAENPGTQQKSKNRKKIANLIFFWILSIQNHEIK